MTMSKQPRKQRAELAHAPLHERGVTVHATLTDDLREEYGTRRTRVNAGDTVEVMRGDFSGVEGEVLRVDLESGTIHVEEVTVETADGEEVARPIRASNVRITDLDLSDDRREARLRGENDE